MKALALNRVALTVSCVGLFISGILSIGQYYRYSVPCGSSNGCDLVAMDPSSHALGIPNAYLGFLVYAFLAGLAYWRMISPTARKALVIGYALAILSTIGSLALTYY
ncbi:MAG: vitamin K epoxide reductase family protein, partial [Fimbriimonadales bacterium]